jgi:hypothetical protein
MSAAALRWLAAEPGSGTRLFRLCAAVSLGLQAALALGRQGIHGGGDLVPHLRLIQLTQEQLGIHNIYAPGYHLLGALLEPVLGFEGYTKLFSLAAAALLILGFRSFQRAAALPDAASALFALTPYLLSLSLCTPKVEAAGYGVLLFGLGALLRGRSLALVLLLALCFVLHTASALLFGLAAGVLCLARRDLRGLVALAAGTLLALPLVAAQLAAGCSLSEALLFAQGGYARDLHESVLPGKWPWILPLANPVALVAAALGARALWDRERALAILCGVLVALYLNNFWLAPFDLRTLVTPIRGLSLLAIPVAIAAGVFAASRPRAGVWVAGLSLVWALVSAVWVVPEACFVRRIAAAEIAPVRVERCLFVWRGPDPGGRR